MPFPSPDELRSPATPLEFGGAGFEIVRFVYDRGKGGKASIEITWRNEHTREQFAYRFRSVVIEGLWPIDPVSHVVVDNVLSRQWEATRPLAVYEPQPDGHHAVMFRAGTVEVIGTGAGLESRKEEM